MKFTFKCSRCDDQYSKVHAYTIGMNDEWIVCESCQKLFDPIHQECMENFIQPERSKREDDLVHCNTCHCDCNNSDCDTGFHNQKCPVFKRNE